MLLKGLKTRLSGLGKLNELVEPASSPWGWMSFIHASVLATAAAIALHGLARREGGFRDSYAEFVAGVMSAAGQPKNIDYHFVTIWFGVFVAIFALSQVLYRRLASRCAAPDEPLRVTLLAYVPALPALATLWAAPLEIEFIGLSAIAVMVLPLALLLGLRFGERFAGGQLEDFAAAAWAAGLFAVCVPIACNVVAARLLPGTGTPLPALKLAVAGAGMAAIAAFLVARSIDDLIGKGKELVLLLQLPLPLLLLIALPSPILLDGHSVSIYAAKPALYGLLAALMAAAWVSLARRWAAFVRGSAEESTAKLLDPLCIAALLVFIAYPSIAPILSLDDFHFGEKLYGWYQWWAFGQLPFADTVQVHGFVDVLPGLFSLWFYDGGLAALPLGLALVKAIAGIGTLVALARLTGTGWALLLMLPLSAQVHFERLAPLFMLATILLAPQLIERPARWLTVWGLGSFLVTFWYPAGGSALVTGSLPFVIYMGLRLWNEREKDRRGALALAAAIAAGVLALVLTPLGRMALGIVDFLLEGAKLNAVAYGLPLRWETVAELAQGPGAMRSALLFHVLRFIWMPLAALAGLRLLVELGRPVRAPATILAWLLVLGVALISIPYSLGRIDAFSLSRLGTLTLLVAGIFMIASTLEASRNGVYAGFAVLALIMLPNFPTGRIQQAISKAHATPVFGSDTAASMRLAQELGYGPVVFPDVGYIQRLTELRQIIDTVLDPSETFYDMTNRSALYTYMNRRMPVSWAAVYTDISSATQARTVRQLEAAQPPLLLLGPGTNFDGVKPSLRTYWVYRHVMGLGYRTRRFGEYDLLVRPDRVARLDALRMLRISRFEDVNWKTGVLRAGGTAFLVADPQELVGLTAGDTLNFAASGRRKITAINQNRVDLDAGIDPDRDGFPRLARVVDKALPANEPGLALYDRVFAMPSLLWTPQTWGRSWDMLRHRLREVFPLDLAGQDVALHDVTRTGDVYQVTGGDPFVAVPLAQPLAGTDAGMVVLRFQCVEGTPRSSRNGHRMRIYWNTAEFGISEQTMVEFQAAEGLLIVPMDHLPRWLLSKAITQVRFDLERGDSTCTAFRISDAALMARNDFGR